MKNLQNSGTGDKDTGGNYIYIYIYIYNLFLLEMEQLNSYLNQFSNIVKLMWEDQLIQLPSGFELIYYWRRGNSAFQAVYGQNLKQLLAAWSKHLSAFLITVFGDIPAHCVFLKQNYLPSMKNLYFWRIRSNRQDYKSFFPFS